MQPWSGTQLSNIEIEDDQGAVALELGEHQRAVAILRVLRITI
jgi:hypothetical protein